MTKKVRAQAPYIVFGLVGPLGSDLDGLIDKLSESLSGLAYEAVTVHAIEAVHQLEPWRTLSETPADVRYETHMTAGDQCRENLQRADAIALLAVGKISKLSSDPMMLGTRARAFIIRSIKRPEETRTLRKAYGDSFHLIAAYSPRELRLERLATKIAESNNDLSIENYRAKAEELLSRDQEDRSSPFGQRVRKAYELADVFIDTSDQQRMTHEVERFVRLLFGHPFLTPTRSEYCMFHAQAAALRSATLGRQVGAVIATTSGDILSIGTNEVPKAGGGLYWAGDENDNRDFVWGYETNDRMKRLVLSDIVERLDKAGWLDKDKVTPSTRESLIDRLSQELQNFQGAHFTNLIEFLRPVHAEMAAILDAARRGVAVQDAILYCTTFPCHECAKLIVGAGILKVVYIEPYPKSLARELYLDSISIDGPSKSTKRVAFEQFVGLAPRRYMSLFSMPERKDLSGKAVAWVPTQSEPRLFSLQKNYKDQETFLSNELKLALDRWVSERKEAKQ